jgi:hypothetical protein
MGILNRILGINLTNEDPLENSPFSASQNESYITPPPPTSEYMITEIGQFMQTETGSNLMITE